MTKCNMCGRENASYIKICPKCGNSLSSSTTISQRTFSVHSTVKYAGFWRRVAACLIDFFITWITGFVVAYIAGLMLGLSWRYRGTYSLGYYGSIGTMIGIVVTWLYSAMMESSPYQATLAQLHDISSISRQFKPTLGNIKYKISMISSSYISVMAKTHFVVPKSSAMVLTFFIRCSKVVLCLYGRSFIPTKRTIPSTTLSN
jgi:hypothetical protein